MTKNSGKLHRIEQKKEETEEKRRGIDEKSGIVKNGEIGRVKDGKNRCGETKKGTIFSYCVRTFLER